MTIHSLEQATLSYYNPNDLRLKECNMKKTHAVELLSKEKFVSRSSTPKCVTDITNDTNSKKVAQENSSTFDLQVLQEMDPNVSVSNIQLQMQNIRCVLLNQLLRGVYYTLLCW